MRIQILDISMCSSELDQLPTVGLKTPKAHCAGPKGMSLGRFMGRLNGPVTV